MRALFTGDDTSLVLDTIEGETDLLEAIDAVIAEIDETDVLVTGLREKETQFAARRRSMEERVKRLRALIEQAMAISEQHSLRRPAATLSLRQDTARCGGDVGGGGARRSSSSRSPRRRRSSTKRASDWRCRNAPAGWRRRLRSRIRMSGRRSCRRSARSPAPCSSNGGFSLQIRRS